MIQSNSSVLQFRAAEFLSALVGAGVLVAAACGLFVPGFYEGLVDPQYLMGNITNDLILLVCTPLLGVCLLLERGGSLAARLLRTSLLAFMAYSYAVYTFDRIYTVLFPLYMALFGLACFAIAFTISGIDAARVAGCLKNMRLRRVNAVYLAFTGLVLYVIEAPIILARIPGGAGQGGTPFMVLDMALVAPMAVLIGVWLWQRRPWGYALAGIFLVKAVTLMTSFLLADYYNWFKGTLANPGATVAFTVVNLLAYAFAWNYFACLRKE